MKEVELRDKPRNFPINRPWKQHVTHLSKVLKLTNISIFQSQEICVALTAARRGVSLNQSCGWWGKGRWGRVEKGGEVSVG
jgi:hypothetical protein